jgi:hypothetical protein
MIVIAAVSGLAVGAADADISYGPYTFDDAAFADRVVDNDGGTYQFNNPATTLDEALLGFSPDSGLYNIGFGDRSNDFTLFFDDLAATDIAGADIVLFDLRWSADPYEIAVISGGVESAFLAYDAASQINTGERQDGGAAVAWAIEIDLADYGVASAEAIRFRALQRSGGRIIEGDPTMAGVLIPAPGALALLGLAGCVAARRRR